MANRKLARYRAKCDFTRSAEPSGDAAAAPARRLRFIVQAGQMPKFIPLQLCRLVDRPPVGEGWIHEIKFDGYRMLLRVEQGGAALRTRKGLDWTARFPAIAAAASKLP